MTAQQQSGGLQSDLSVYPRQPKRVPRACDPCRKKRIKCSAGQRPCMNCILYRATCTDSPVVPARVQKSKRTQSLAALISRDDARQGRSQERGHSVGAGQEPPAPSHRPPTPILLDDDTLMEPVRHDCDTEDAQRAPPPDIHDPIPRTGGLLSPDDPWDSNLYMPNVFDFADSPNISDLTDSLLVDFPAFNSVFSESQERPLTQGVREEVDKGPRPMSSTTKQPNVAGVHFLKDGLPSRKAASLLPGLFLKKDASDSRYQGLNSIGGTLSSCLIYAKNHSPELGEQSLMRYLIQGITYMDEAKVCVPPIIDPHQLPDREFVEHGVESFFKIIYLRYPIVSLDWRHSWKLWYEGGHGPPDPIQFMSIFIMAAIGATVHPSGPTEEMKEKISSLHQRAWSQMDYVLAHPYTGSVQVILLHTLYFTQQGKLGIAWSTCGTALRVAQSIGLHRQTPTDLQLTDELVRLRGRLWWVAFSLDALLSLCEGRPTGTSTDKTDTKIEPLLVQECPEDMEPGPGPGPMIYVWHVTLARLVNPIADVIGREKDANGRLYCLAELDAELIAWRDGIPLEFRPDQEILAPSSLRHHVTWLHVQFFNVLRTLHWTSMLLSQKKDESFFTDKHLRLQSSEAICVASARSLIRTSNSRSVVSDSREIRILGAPSAYFLAATSTIFMHILKEPQRLSATADVEYLRAGIHHLTSEFFADQLGQGQQILIQMLQLAEGLTNGLKCITR